MVSVSIAHRNPIIRSYNDLSSNLNAGIQTDLLLLDFSKAFDKVSHKRLLSKINYLFME